MLFHKHEDRILQDHKQSSITHGKQESTWSFTRSLDGLALRQVFGESEAFAVFSLESIGP